MAIGDFALVLHAHLPYVRHPEHADFFEEDWFYEAVIDTYIPLLEAFERLAADGVRFRVTMSLTPTLCEMMADELLMSRCVRRTDRLRELAEREAAAYPAGHAHGALARHYLDAFGRARALLDRTGHRLLGAFRALQDAGHLEILTCAATHGLLPLMATDEARRAQIEIGCRNYEKHFGRRPRGLWLPECAYSPGLEEPLRTSGVRYFFLDTHGVLFGDPRPKYGVFRPVLCPNGVAAFGRDVESSVQVWSSEHGYPGDPAYREFYRDVGYDADYAYVRPYLRSDGLRGQLGIKYHRVTGRVPLHEKEPYDLAAARERAAEHAGNFLFNRQGQLRHLRTLLKTRPVVVSPYDAELFGHWWYEGPMFLEFLFRKLHHDQDEIDSTTPMEILDRGEAHQVIEPSHSSWGDKGYMEVWLNRANDWIYPHLHAAEHHMAELARRFPRAEGILARALNQAARELVLAQASDWAFIMTTGTTVPYAEKRTRDHLSRFHGLYLQLTEDRLEEAWLAELEGKDNLFSEIDYRLYA